MRICTCVIIHIGEWDYCDEHDSRFHNEIMANVGVNEKLLYSTSYSSTVELPPRTYDVIEGYYNPRYMPLVQYDV